jgi:hypothetical protein
MMLSDTDKADLVKAASGDLDAQTRRRAGELLKSAPEAVEFLAAIKNQSELLTSVFGAAERAIPEEPLDPEKVAALTSAILRRADSMQRRIFWRRVLAVAAVIVLVATPLAVWKLWAHRPIGHAISTRFGFTGGTSRHIEKFPIRSGSPVVTDKEFTAVSLGRNKLAIAPASELEVRDAISLSKGSLFIVAIEPVSIRAGGNVEILAEGEILVSISDEVTCRVVRGSAHLTAEGRSDRIGPGEQLVVNQDGPMVAGPSPRSLPLWVEPALGLLEEQTADR